MALRPEEREEAKQVVQEAKVVRKTDHAGIAEEVIMLKIAGKEKDLRVRVRTRVKVYTVFAKRSGEWRKELEESAGESTVSQV